MSVCCPKCQKANPDNACFCLGCGATLGATIVQGRTVIASANPTAASPTPALAPQPLMPQPQAVFTSPSILFSLGSARGLAFIGCMAIAGFLAALGIKEFANKFLQRPGEPWYIRPGAAIFIPIIMMCMNALACLVYNLAFRLLDLSHVIPQRAIIFAFMAMEFLWIVILDWPARYERPYRDAVSSRGPSSSKPHFTPFNDKPWENEPF